MRIELQGNANTRAVSAWCKSTERLQYLQEASEDVINELKEAKEAGVTYMMGHSCVIAREASCILKKLVINYVYGFLRRNSRCPATSLGIQHSVLIEVGMVYRV